MIMRRSWSVSMNAETIEVGYESTLKTYSKRNQVGAIS